MVHDTYRNEPLLGKKITIQFARPLRKDTPSFVSSNTSSDTLVPDSVPEERPANPRNPARYPVIIMNLHRDVRWQELKDFGRLTGCLVAYCDLDRGRNGRGFIEYFTRKDAEKAIRTLDGRRLLGKEVRVVGWERLRSRGRSRSRSVPEYYERSRRSCSPRRSTRDSPRDHVYCSNGDSMTTVYEPRYYYPPPPPPPPPPYPYHTLDKPSRPYFCPEEASPYRETGYGWDSLHYYDYYNSGQYGEDTRADHSYGMAAYE